MSQALMAIMMMAMMMRRTTTMTRTTTTMTRMVVCSYISVGGDARLHQGEGVNGATI